MIFSRRFLTLISGLLVLFSLPLKADSLWEQALEHTAPGDTSPLVAVTMEALRNNRDGEVTGTQRMEYAVDSETGEFILISAFEDDKDVTEKEQRKAERNQDDEEESRSQYIHPIFNPENAEDLELIPAGYEAVIDGQNCVVYFFRLENERAMGPGSPKQVTEEGHLYLERDSGMPLKIESRLVDGPNSLKTMTYSMHAVPGPDGSWRTLEGGYGVRGPDIRLHGRNIHHEFPIL